MNLSAIRSLLQTLPRLSLVIVTLLLMASAATVEPAAWGATVPNRAHQTVPPFAFHLKLPFLNNRPTPINVTNNLGYNTDPTWSPDGTQIVYTEWGPWLEDNTELVIVHEDGSDATQLTNELFSRLPPNYAPWYFGSADWSPNGIYIAAEATTCSPCGVDEVVHQRLLVINADGRNPRVLHNAGAPRWSPDNTKILFTDPVSSLGVVSSDGKTVTFLVEAGSWPEWSPDSTKIAFVRQQAQAASPAPLAVINADGSSLSVLEPENADSFSPIWSPDGSQIAYFTHQANHLELRVINADGSDPTILGEVEWQRLSNLAWLPDGKRLIFMGQDAEQPTYGVFLIDRDGINLKFLQSLQADIGLPRKAWSPDRSKIVYSYADIYVLRIPGW